MKKLEYSNRFFHDSLFVNDNCVVDNEIMNDISPDWVYEQGVPICVGFLYKDKITIYLATEEGDQEFKNAVKDHLAKMTLKTYLYSFNRKMEVGNFKSMLDIKPHIKEIKPFNARGWNKDRFYTELLGKEVIPRVQVADVFEGDASRCITNWEKYVDTGSIEFLMEIAEHNVNCLLKESAILKNKAFFLKNYNINERGWLEQ